MLESSLAHPGFLSRILIFFHPTPDSTTTKKEVKKILLSFFVGKNFIKQERKVEPIDKELFLTQTIVTKLSEIWVWNPGSGKNLFRIRIQEIKKAPDPGSATQSEKV